MRKESSIVNDEVNLINECNNSPAIFKLSGSFNAKHTIHASNLVTISDKFKPLESN